MALSDVKVCSANPEAKTYKLTDDEDTVLLVHPNGSKYWRLCYCFGGKEEMLALGKYPEVSLADERELLEGVKHSQRGSKIRTSHLVPLSR